MMSMIINLAILDCHARYLKTSILGMALEYNMENRSWWGFLWGRGTVSKVGGKTFTRE